MVDYGDVRLAVDADETEIMRLMVMIHGETGRYSFDEDKVRATVYRALDRKGGIIGVIGDSGDIKGCIVMLLEPVWYSQEWNLIELLNFVRPDCRKSDFAVQLINFSKNITRQMKLTLGIGVFNGVRTEAKLKMYDRHFERAGAFYFFDPRVHDKKPEPQVQSETV